MGRFAKTAVFLLMAVVGSSTLGNGSLLFRTQPLDQHAGGCHEHGSKAPSPPFSSYQCCLIGHNVAVPQTFHSLEPFLHQFQTKLAIEAPVTSLTVGMEKTFVSSGDPPGAIPLRI